MRKKKADPIVTGFLDCQKLLNQFNAASNPRKVYVFGKRVHHGPIFALISLYGLYKGDGYLFGYGLDGTLDDVGDVKHWLDFEPGGNPDSIIDVV